MCAAEDMSAVPAMMFAHEEVECRDAMRAIARGTRDVGLPVIACRRAGDIAEFFIVCPCSVQNLLVGWLVGVGCAFGFGEGVEGAVLGFRRGGWAG
jgi:hypothetical protein